MLSGLPVTHGLALHVRVEFLGRALRHVGGEDGPGPICGKAAARIGLSGLNVDRTGPRAFRNVVWPFRTVGLAGTVRHL